MFLVFTDLFIDVLWQNCNKNLIISHFTIWWTYLWLRSGKPLWICCIRFSVARCRKLCGPNQCIWRRNFRLFFGRQIQIVLASGTASKRSMPRKRQKLKRSSIWYSVLSFEKLFIFWSTSTLNIITRSNGGRPPSDGSVSRKVWSMILEILPVYVSIQFFQRIFQFTNLFKPKLIINKTTRFFIAHFVVFISKVRI